MLEGAHTPNPPAKFATELVNYVNNSVKNKNQILSDSIEIV